MDQILPYIPYITAFAGLLTGVLLTFLGFRYRSNAERVRAAERIRAAEKFIADLEAGSAHLESELQKVRQSEAGLMRHQGELEALARTSRRANEEKQALLQEAEQRLAQTFETLSQRALQTSQEEFARYARTAVAAEREDASADLADRRAEVETIVKPVTESLEKVQKRIAELESAREGAYTSLQDQVREMSDVQKGLRKDAGHLARALRQPGGRGRWGEMQLRRVVELAGMEPYCDFSVPAAGKDGKAPGPDLIVNLPGGQRVHIDAGVPMEAYLEAIEGGDEQSRERAAQRHAEGVANHIAAIAPDTGEAPFGLAPEFSVLFFPGEAVFSTALAHDPGLVEKGAERGVILATPATLIALLRAVAAGWRQETIATNARSISDAGRELHDRVSAMTDRFARLGRSLDSTVRHYNRTLAAVESNVLPSARRLEDLGNAAPSAPLPDMVEVGRHTRLPGGLSSLPVSDEGVAANAAPDSPLGEDDFEGFAPVEPDETPVILATKDTLEDLGDLEDLEPASPKPAAEHDPHRAAHDLRAAAR